MATIVQYFLRQKKIPVRMYKLCQLYVVSVVDWYRAASATSCYTTNGWEGCAYTSSRVLWREGKRRGGVRKKRGKKTFIQVMMITGPK